MKLSIIKNMYQVIGEMEFEDVIAEIRTGKVKGEIEKIRSLFRTGRIPEAQKLKKNLPAFTISGTFNQRRAEYNLLDYSQMMCLDIDGILLETLVKIIFDRACTDRFTYACFRSPSGRGIKIFVKVLTNKNLHKKTYDKVATYYEQLLNTKIDRSGSDIARMCYYSYDPAIYYNKNPTSFISESGGLAVIEILGSMKSKKDEPAILTDNQILFEKLIAFTERKVQFVEGSRNSFVFQLSCNCNRVGLSLVTARELIHDGFTFDDNEDVKTIESAYKNNKQQFGIYSFDELIEIVDEVYTVCFPPHIYEQLPELLKRCCNVFESPHEKDIILLSSVTVISGLLDKVTGQYDNRNYTPALFCFIVAPPASSKGILSFTKELAMKIHSQMIELSREAMSLYKAQSESKIKKKDNGDDPEILKEPPFKMYFIPGNSSSAAIMKILQDCDGKGMIFETEADTLANSFKKDWGNFSDMLRKMFHHEPISSYRKVNNEYIEVSNPRGSVLLSSTPSQVSGVLQSAKDGLFSRFIYYMFKSPPVWKDVSPSSENNSDLKNHFAALSHKVKEMVQFFDTNETIIEMSPVQWQKHHDTFETWLAEANTFYGEDMISIIKRLGLIAFRFAMFFTTLRKFEDGVGEKKILCTDEDFDTAMCIVEVCKQHAVKIYETLPKADRVDGAIFRLYEALPSEKSFQRKDAVEIGQKISIEERTVDKYLSKMKSNGLLVKGGKYGGYVKK